MLQYGQRVASLNIAFTYLIDVTSQFLATAALQILLPKNPFPPQTTIFLLADADAAAVDAIVAVVVLGYVGYLCGLGLGASKLDRDGWNV